MEGQTDEPAADRRRRAVPDDRLGAVPDAPDDRDAAVREAHRKMCALFDACRDDGSPRGTRDAALLSVLYGAGVPREVALALPLAAYDPVRAVLRWRAEGEPRARRATEGARAALADWREVRGDAVGPLLCRLDGRTGAPRALTHDDVTSAIRRWASRVGVEELEEADLDRLYTSPWWEDVDEEKRQA